MKEIKVGVLGTGFMGKAHIYGYKTIPLYYEPGYKIKLAGICSGKLENAQKFKDLYDFEFATANEDDIFSREDIDVINICTPDPLHKKQILKALDAGKHIYCEKPLLASMENAGEILNHPNLKKVTTQTVFHSRFFANVLRAKQIIDEGRLGKIYGFRGHFLSGGLAKAGQMSGWRCDSKASGGNGVLYDVGSHICDMVYYLLGAFGKIYAKTYMPYEMRGTYKCDTEEAAYMVATLKSGVMGNIEASKLATGTATNMRIEVSGEKGAIIIDFMEPNWLYFYDNTLPEEKLGGYKGFTRIECMQNYETPVVFPKGKHPAGWIRAHVHSLYNFLEGVNAGKQVAPSISDGLYIQNVLDCALKSARENREITTP